VQIESKEEKKTMIIVRYGEIGLKSPRTRKRIEEKLIDNIRQALKENEKNKKVKIWREFGRIFADSDSREEAEKIAKVFGVVSTSLAFETKSDLKSIVSFCGEFAKERIQKSESFAVRARRVNMPSYTSMELASEVGKRIAENSGAKVNLDSPDKKIFIEVRGEKAYVFDEIIKGVGGMPLSTQGKGITLISGGIDSPVAAWLMMKRGMGITALFMDSRPLVDERTIERARKSVEKLAEWSSGPISFYTAPYGEELLDAMKYKNKKLACVLCKRMMYRVAEKLAQKTGANAIITGESLGQVASQTGENLRAISHEIFLPIFRPLISTDKTEIVELARKIGTYEISVAPAVCCLGAPLYPETRAKPEELQEAEKELNLGDKVERIFKNIKVEEIE